MQSIKSAEQLAQVLQPFTGSSGFMVFAEFNQGIWISKFYKPFKGKLYVLGNPVFAKDMLTRDAAVGLYVPTRLYVYEDKHGVTQLAYDQLSSFANQFHDPALTAVTEAIDKKLRSIGRPSHWLKI